MGRITHSRKNYAIDRENWERVRSSADSELRQSCATENQSVSRQRLGTICAEIEGLAGVWQGFGKPIAQYLEPRDRAADVRARKCGIDGGFS
jgi:hypothetical protein